jgi:hypothetical protein
VLGVEQRMAADRGLAALASVVAVTTIDAARHGSQLRPGGHLLRRGSPTSKKRPRGACGPKVILASDQQLTIMAVAETESFPHAHR